MTTDQIKQIADNLAQVRERIRDAAGRARRDPEDVTLVAVSKTQSVEAVRAAWEAGQRVFGENKIQEALAKIESSPPEAVWHLVGRLQTNKARKVPGKFAMVHSVESTALALELEKRAAAQEVTLEVLIQLNASGEETKSGVRDAAGLGVLAGVLLTCPHLKARGLMTMPNPDLDEHQTRAHFGQVRALLSAARTEFGLGVEFDQISMGMTQDFEWAIEEGATIVRVGTAIFGTRQT